MISEAQELLARRIADAGLWKYSSVIKLMEKNSITVQCLKNALAGGPANASYKIGTRSVSPTTRAYANARLSEELGATSFAVAYVYYLNNGSSEVVKGVGDVNAKIAAVREKRPEVTKEWIQEKLAGFLDEQVEYMAKRRLLCMEG